MNKLNKALDDYDYLTISDMYLQGEINKDNLTTYKLIKKVLNNGLYNQVDKIKVKNKEEHEKDFSMIKLITEKSGYDFSFRPEKEKPILYTVLKKKNKPLSVHVARNLKDEDIEFDFPELFLQDSPNMILKSEGYKSSIVMAVLYKNQDFLNYLFTERKFLKELPYAYDPQTTIINKSDIYFKKVPVLFLVKNMTRLVEKLSSSEYADNIDTEWKKTLFYNFANQYKNLNNIKFIEKNYELFLNEPDTYQTITTSLWYDFNNANGNTGFYKKLIEHFDPFSEFISSNGETQSLVISAFRSNAHSWIECMINLGKINKSNIIKFLEDKYQPIDLDGVVVNLKGRNENNVNENIAKTFDLLISKKILKEDDILNNPKIMNQISYLTSYISEIEKRIIMSTVDSYEKNADLKIRKRL